jgi:hypothetical protein
MDHFIIVWVGPQKAAAEAQFLAGKPHLGDREADRLHRQHRDAEEAVGIGLAVISEPAVIGPAGRRGEFRVVDRAREEAKARIKEDCVDAVGSHVGDAFVRVEPAGLAVFVRHCVGLDDALPRPDRPDPPDADPAVADRVLLDDDSLLAVLTPDDPRRPVPKRGIDVFVPQIQRLEDVPVGVDRCKRDP